MVQKLIIKQIEDQTEYVRVLTLRAPDGSPLPSYQAGAHIDFDLGSLGSRSYSLIDWPDTQAGQSHE